MKQLTSYLLCIFCSFNLPAQNIYVFEASIKNLPVSKVYLYNYEGDRNQLIDSATSDPSGTFKFLLKGNWQKGIYKIETGINNLQQKAYSFNFIYNYENIKLSSSLPALNDSMVVLNSEENKLYFGFNKFNNKILRQLSSLFELKTSFPEDDPFYPTLKARYGILYSQYQAYFRNMPGDITNSFAFQFIKANRFPVFGFTTPKSEVRPYLLTHYFDYTDFNNNQLLRTDFFTGKAFSFIQMFRNPNLDKAAQEAEFIKATDIVLKAASVNKKVQVQIIDYLVRGFEQVGMDGVLTHIAKNYIEDSSCTDVSTVNNLNKKLEGFTKMAPGKTVPDITIDCADKGFYNLYKSKASYTLIIFWASWCPHCQESLPQFKKVYDGLKDKSLDIIAISIDTSASEWNKALSAGAYTWKNCCDLMGWNSSIAKNYHVSATPTVFLVDKQKKIIAKPLAADELLSKLQELGIQ